VGRLIDSKPSLNQYESAEWSLGPTKAALIKNPEVRTIHWPQGARLCQCSETAAEQLRRTRSCKREPAQRAQAAPQNRVNCGPRSSPNLVAAQAVKRTGICWAMLDYELPSLHLLSEPWCNRLPVAIWNTMHWSRNAKAAEGVLEALWCVVKSSMFSPRSRCHAHWSWSQHQASNLPCYRAGG